MMTYDVHLSDSSIKRSLIKAGRIAQNQSSCHQKKIKRKRLFWAEHIQKLDFG